MQQKIKLYAALACALVALAACGAPAQNSQTQAGNSSGLKFLISVPKNVSAKPLTGRVYVILAKAQKPDPRIQVLSPESSPPFFGVDVNALAAGSDAVIDASALGYPTRSLASLPAGDYYVEGLASVYMRYNRADGHTIWAPPQWGPQVFSVEPGNFYSPVQSVHIDPAKGGTISLRLTQVVSEKDIAGLLGGQGYDTDTPWVKHVRFKSAILSKWWGTPIYLGATVLLPKGYASHPNSHYPVVYNQGHYYQPVPWDFTTDAKTETPQSHAAGQREGIGTGYEFYQAWNSANFPRFLMVTWQHPCPFFDDSYAVNSANCGPYGDAIMKELIPFVESHFRVLPEPRARLTEGGSTGGWESLALLLQHPKFFGGAYVFDPDPIDFNAFQLVNIYKDPNGFYAPAENGAPSYARTFDREPNGQSLVTEKDLSVYEEVMGSKGRSEYQLDGWWAIFDPAGPDGYPAPLWNMRTGVIDKNVASYMRSHGYDLDAFMQQHWAQLAPLLDGKLKFVVGDMDSYYLNLAVYKTQDFLQSAKPDVHATFTFGRPMKGHGWHPMTWAQLMEEMAVQVRANTPAGESNAPWNY